MQTVNTHMPYSNDMPLLQYAPSPSLVSSTSFSTSPASSSSPSPSASPSRVPSSSKMQQSTSRGKNAPCGHNAWDNVRVIKGQVTLRCRECQVQWRTQVDSAWRKRRCAQFNNGGCAAGPACQKVHMFTKKQSLEERIGSHGSAVLVPVPSIAQYPQQHRHQFQEFMEGRAQAARRPHGRQQNTASVHHARPCSHNSWDNVRVRKGLVTLRCRVCQEQWRRALAGVERCPAFPSCADQNCARLHLHESKMTAEERRARDDHKQNHSQGMQQQHQHNVDLYNTKFSTDSQTGFAHTALHSHHTAIQGGGFPHPREDCFEGSAVSSQYAQHSTASSDHTSDNAEWSASQEDDEEEGDTQQSVRGGSSGCGSLRGCGSSGDSVEGGLVRGRTEAPMYAEEEEEEDFADYNWEPRRTMSCPAVVRRFK